jgi:uncharacterized protein YndB with AHSA1/START domain
LSTKLEQHVMSQVTSAIRGMSVTEARVIDIGHEIKIKATPDRVYAALTKVDELKAWHSGQVSGRGEAGGVLHIEGSGKPGFKWKVTELSPPQRVGWICTAGPGDSVGTTVLFELTPADQGRTLVACTHAGWPGTHGNYRKCNTLWGVLLHHLKQYVETGTATPAFP